MDELNDINPFAQEGSEGASNNNNAAQSPQTTPRSQPPPPLPTKHSFPEPPNYKQNQFKSDFCCSRDHWLHSGDDNEVLIVDAQKTSDGSTGSYITYIIRTGSMDSRRRYSEFESLRNGLVRLYPTLIIPPIPSKTTIGDYAAKQSKAKDDVNMISRRKRLLHSFLNRLARHPILSNEHVFHRFLQNDVSWSEVLNSPPLSLLPKNLLKAPAHSPTDSSSTQVYAALPTPSAAQPLRQPDQRFLDSEAFTEKFASHVSGPMEKVTRRTMKRWTEFSHDHSDLGAALNGFSLNEDGPLAAAIEKTGQAIDATYLSTSTMLQELEASWAEPLHEYGQFATIIKKLLLYRHQKHVQFEMTQHAIESKKEELSELERVETEAQRLTRALTSGRARPPNAVGRVAELDLNGQSEERSNPTHAGDFSQFAQSSSPLHGGEEETRSNNQQESEGSGSFGSPELSDNDIPSYTTPVQPPKRRTPGMGLLNALSYSIHGMMDVDPETARRNSMTKTRESISQLEDALQASAQDLKYASSTIQADLDRFQRQKVADIRDMAIAMAKAHRDWCKKNLQAWEEVKKEAAAIETHPNDLAAGDGTVDQGVAPAPSIITR